MARSDTLASVSTSIESPSVSDHRTNSQAVVCQSAGLGEDLDRLLPFFGRQAHVRGERVEMGSQARRSCPRRAPQLPKLATASVVMSRAVVRGAVESPDVPLTAVATRSP